MIFINNKIFNKKRIFVLFFLFVFCGDFASPAYAHAGVLDWIINFLSSFFDALIDILVWVLESLFYILSEFPYLILDGFLLIIEGAFTLLDLSGLALDTAIGWTSLPGPLIWILGEIDFSQGISIMASSVGIRMLINLIPGAFTRI